MTRSFVTRRHSFHSSSLFFFSFFLITLPPSDFLFFQPLQNRPHSDEKKLFELLNLFNSYPPQSFAANYCRLLYSTFTVPASLARKIYGAASGSNFPPPQRLVKSSLGPRLVSFPGAAKWNLREVKISSNSLPSSNSIRKFPVKLNKGKQNWKLRGRKGENDDASSLPLRGAKPH